MTDLATVEHLTLLHACETSGEGLECVRRCSCDHSDALRRLRTQDAVSALQFEGLFAAAQVVDEVAQLVDVLQTLRHDHLLVHQVGLGQVGAGLDTHTAPQIHRTSSSRGPTAACLEVAPLP